jgi:hypothetical protein
MDDTDDVINDTMQDSGLGDDDDLQSDAPETTESTVLADPPVVPGEAVAETVAGQEVDPADVEKGDDEIAEHVAEGEGVPI